jgi:putative glycosyltransferase (TIGR04348 family)
MKIALITPAPPHTRSGNRNTAMRWARMLRALGHDTRVQVKWDGKPADAMIALHARKSHTAITAYAARYPGQPLVVVLTGTDLYRDIDFDPSAQESLRLATRLVTLHPLVDGRLRKYRVKQRVVVQSARTAPRVKPLTSCFEVLVSGHLREEKDPFRAAAAAALLPPESRIQVTHLGRALDAAMAATAEEWMTRTPRYRWRGERPHAEAMRLMRRARLMVISSRMEGGANVVSEALASGTPIIASRIPGNVGLLGANYAGYYPVGDERALAKLLARAEQDEAFYARLARECAARAPLVSPASESAALERLLDELQSTVRVDSKRPGDGARR